MILSSAFVPFQFAFAVGGQLAGGYDSTAVNPRTGLYQDAGFVNAALDVQLTHQTDTVRQILRSRGEAMYEATGGRDLLDSDLFSVTRYGLIWEPTEDLHVYTDASYAVGAPTLYFSRAGRPDVSFARAGLAFPHQLVADYVVRQDVTQRFSDVDGLQLEAAVQGRYPVTSQLPGQNMFTPYAAARATHEFDEDNNGHAGARFEYYNLELFRPAMAIQGFVGWGHNFFDGISTLLEAGVTTVQSDLQTSRWDVQPYGRATLHAQFDRLRLMLGAAYTHTFGVVSATLGTGALDIGSVAAYFRPGGPLVTLFADAAIQRGEAFDPTSGKGLTAVFATVGAGGRVRVLPWAWLFVRYEFQWQTDEGNHDASIPDFVRHVAFAGVQVAWGSEPEALAAMLPVEEVAAMEHTFGIGPDAADAPVRAAEPAVDEPAQRRRDWLPGDPPDDPLERDERERRNRRNQPGGADQPDTLPGGGDVPEPGDPFGGGDEQGNEHG
jgi:hypothetical protein